jgi:hypothetical protein
VPWITAAVATANENEDAAFDDAPWTTAAAAADNKNEDAVPQAALADEETLAMTEEDGKICAEEGHTTTAIEDITTTKVSRATNPEEVEQEEENRAEKQLEVFFVQKKIYTK